MAAARVGSYVSPKFASVATISVLPSGLSYDVVADSFEGSFSASKLMISLPDERFESEQMTVALPDRIESMVALEDLLSEPDQEVVSTLSQVEGDIAVIGAGGKMGPSLARMVRRGFDRAGKQSQRVFAVSRFTDPKLHEEFKSHGVIPIRADMLNPSHVAALPAAVVVFAMAGLKFGTSEDASATWATNVLLPAAICRRYPQSKIVAFSSGNIYGLVPSQSLGSKVGDPLKPQGEYATTVLGRERVYEYYAKSAGIQSVLLRLNYAVEMRYGVLVDIARKVSSGEPIEAGIGMVNVIWQGDANRMAIRSLTLADALASKLNIAGDAPVAIRHVVQQFAACFGTTASVVGDEHAQAFLNDASESYERIGGPTVSTAQMITWIANWMDRKMPQWDLSTHFENHSGDF